MFKTFKKEIKNRSNFIDNCLILHSLFKIRGENHVWSRRKGIVKYCLDI